MKKFFSETSLQLGFLPSNSTILSLFGVKVLSVLLLRVRLGRLSVLSPMPYRFGRRSSYKDGIFRDCFCLVLLITSVFRYILCDECTPSESFSLVNRERTYCVRDLSSETKGKFERDLFNEWTYPGQGSCLDRSRGHWVLSFGWSHVTTPTGFNERVSGDTSFRNHNRHFIYFEILTSLLD